MMPQGVLPAERAAAAAAGGWRAERDARARKIASGAGIGRGGRDGFRL